MRDLLTDNIALHDQMEAVYGHSQTLPIPGIPRSRFRDVPSLPSWLYCFLAYVAVQTPDGPTRDMLSYARIITREALRHGGSGWQDYDRNFRRQVEIDPNLRWNTLLPDLQATTILGQRTGGGSFCSLCRGVDHTPPQCALQWLQSPPAPVPPQSTPVTAGRRQRLQRPTGQNGPICTSWNMGSCTYPGSCTFRHVCRTCYLPHRAKDCLDTPPDSIFKRGRQPPPPMTGEGLSSRQ